MKKTGICVLVALLCMSCPLWVTDDDEIPTGFPPVAWKDSMLFLATSNPSQVQLWDTETRTLVRTYPFQDGSDIYEIEADKDCFWLYLIRSKGHFIKVNATTGEVREIGLDIRPDYLQYLENALWVFDIPDPRKGLVTRRLNREGRVEEAVTVERSDIEFVRHKNILFSNGSYLVPIRTNSDNKKDPTCFYIANLSDGGSLTPVPVNDLYPSGFPGADIYDAILEQPDPWHSSVTLYPEGYADVLFLQSEVVWRWFYKVKSFVPLRLSGPIITYHRQETRSNFYLAKTDQYLFIGGRLLYGPADDLNYNGLEIGVYPPEGGAELKKFRLWNSNQAIYARKNGETWFGKNIWTWDYEKDKWGPEDPAEAYLFDETNVKLYRVSANGTTIEIPPQ